MTVTVTALHLYPVKSLGSITVTSTKILRTGIQHDRNWMVVKPDGTFLTQRTHPQMALVETTIENNTLVLNSFGMDPLYVPTPGTEAARLETEVWGDGVSAIDTGDAAADWLSQAIGESCRLTLFPESEQRFCDPSVAKEGDHTMFADAYPLLVISEASLEDLNSRLATPVSMDRFRPNIVVSGCAAFAEDTWKAMVINGARFRMLDRCARCSVPTIDPTLGTLSGPEPIHTLNSYRSEGDEVYFGMNAASDGESLISVGDAVELL